jgi:integrase
VEISVKVTKFSDRKFWLMYYDDPITGKRPMRSTKETTEAGARKAAGKWEAELKEGRYKPKSNVTWAEFRQAFLFEHLKGAPRDTFKAYVSSLNAVERHCTVNRLAELTSARIAHVAKKLHEAGNSASTIGTYLRHLRAALNWAASPRVGMLATAPAIESPKGSTGKMKGRPITGEEFDRMLAKIPAALAEPRRYYKPKDAPKRKMSPEAAERRRERLEKQAKADAPAWERLLRGLWLSGLRLREAVALTWDDDMQPRVELSGSYPMFAIPGECQKGGRDTLTPITPDFHAMLLETAPEDRVGNVFKVTGREGEALADENLIGRVISAIGEVAGVVVDKAAGKYASAHDLRRSFGCRWAPKVMPAVLKDLMRHRSIQTTMAYYVGQNAEQNAAAIWATTGQKPQDSRVNTFVNSEPSDDQTKKQNKPQPIED